jgi:hypothetical protein
MTNPPTGRLVPTADGSELILSRTFRAPIEDVWASVTEPDRTARWFAHVSPSPGESPVRIHDRRDLAAHQVAVPLYRIARLKV